jgi:hypothetical protein
MKWPFGILTSTIAFAIIAPLAAQATQITFNVPIALTHANSTGQRYGYTLICSLYTSTDQTVPSTVISGGPFSLDSTGSFSGTLKEVINTSSSANKYKCFINTSPGTPPLVGVSPVSGSM